MHVLADMFSRTWGYPLTMRLILTLHSINSDLNRLIMDYLVIEGYKSAAEEFSQEARLTPPVDFESIESRMEIREALQRGDVEDAISRVNELNPEVSRGFQSHTSYRKSQGLNRFMHHS
jgi:molybdopterin-guanine dinucleotide biosynthesis protein